MFNPHPPLSSFPFVLVILALVLRTLSFNSKFAHFRSYDHFCLCACALISPLTYYSGYWASGYASQSFQVPPELIVDHQFRAQLFLVSLIPTITLCYLETRLPQPKFLLRTLSFFSLCASTLLVISTGSLGGELVFQYGAGVQLERTE